jgi:hypothetical protein
VPGPTVYLSRLIGVVALVIGAAMLADRTAMLAMIEHLGQDRSVLILLGILRAGAGAGIVLTHNIWSRGFWPLVVTLTGWAILVRGVINLFLPPDVMAGLLAAAHVVDFYYLYAALPLVLGAYLTLRGFSAAVPSVESGDAAASRKAHGER